MVVLPVIMALGSGSTVKFLVLEQPVVLLVYVSTTLPGATPVTRPALLTVAIAGLLLTHVPPVLGVTLAVEPSQTSVAPPRVGKAVTVTVPVVAEQPVVPLVNVKVTVPADTPVTTPALVTVALLVLLLVHVPPEVGDKVVVSPTQIVVLPVMLTVGTAYTVKLIVLVHPVLVLVNVSVTVPGLIPVTTPEFVTVAILVLLLLHVPLDVGVTVAVEPSHTLVAPPRTGKASTVTLPVVAEHPVVEFVNVNVTVPDAIPVTIPPLVTVAMLVLLLAQVPPVAGERVVFSPTQIEEPPVILTVGKALTVNDFVFEQPVVLLVNVSVTVPGLTPVTKPAFVTVATLVLLLVHVPPVAGVTLAVELSQTDVAPPNTGTILTVTVPVVLEHPVVLLVKVNVAVPAETPVTTPALVTVATLVLLLTQVPPDVGDNVVVFPTQIELPPVIFTTGKALTVKLLLLLQPVDKLVNVIVTVPAETPVTTPALVTVATLVLLLDHVPPLKGVRLAVYPTQTLVAPPKTGNKLTVTFPVVAEHPVVLLVNVKLAVPCVTPVTKPAFVTVATAGLLLVHVPPVVGDKVVVVPIQILLPPVILTAGSALTVNDFV